MYGILTAPLVGVAMKEMVRRAINEIRRQRFIFEAQAKLGYGGECNDLVTSADREAQRIYLKMLRECFPDFGVIAEEDELRVECGSGRQLYFTLDPLDGTKAFGRRQSTGVGTMISLVENGQVLAAYVGDVMTQEIYGYRPESDKVHRISEYEVGETIVVHERPLSQGVLLSRDAPWKFSWPVDQFARDHFKDIDIEGGSIGISFARLWKQEVAALLMGPAYETPWDSSPVIGISRQLGFVFLDVQDGRFSQIELKPPLKVERRKGDLLVIHGQHLPAIQKWMNA
jgi:fructose-1,6-bisphosphatase/inositol monophosphatase family enzyme